MSSTDHWLSHSERLTPTALATRTVIDRWRGAVYGGSITVGMIVKLVKQIEPEAKPEGVYSAIAMYGPNCEDDERWLSQPSPLRGRFYNPKTGEPLG